MTARQRALPLVSVLVAGSIVGLPGWADARVPPSSPPKATEAQHLPTVVLLFEPDRPNSNRLISAIRSHLVGLPVQVAFEPLRRSEILAWLESGHLRARARQALGLVAIDTSHGNVWRLFFLDVDGAPTLIRRLRSSSEHAPLEEAGIAVRLLVEALLDSKQIPAAESTPDGGTSPKAGVPAARSPSKWAGTARSGGSSSIIEPSGQPAGDRGAPGERAPIPLGRLALLLGITGSSWVAEQPWQFGATAGIELALGRPWSLGLAYIWYPALSYHQTETELTLSRHPASSYVVYTPALGLSPRFWVGLGVDAVSRDTIATGAAYRSTAAVTTWSWGPIGGVGVVTPALSAFRARFDLGVHVPTRQVHYVTADSSRALLGSTRHISPFLSVCLSLQL